MGLGLGVKLGYAIARHDMEAKYGPLTDKVPLKFRESIVSNLKTIQRNILRAATLDNTKQHGALGALGDAVELALIGPLTAKDLADCAGYATAAVIDAFEPK